MFSSEKYIIHIWFEITIVRLYIHTSHPPPEQHASNILTMALSAKGTKSKVSSRAGYQIKLWLAFLCFQKVIFCHQAETICFVWQVSLSNFSSVHFETCWFCQWAEFFHIERERASCVIWYRVCNCRHSVWFYTWCVLLHTACKISHNV